jgi:tetratricopeptide (TPR) repeat protein
MLSTLLALSLTLVPSFQDPKPAPPPVKAEPEAIDVVYERLLAAKGDAEIERLLRGRPYEVIGLVDGYLEGWLASQENPGAPAEPGAKAPARMLELAQDAAKRADATFKTDAYSRYANAWKAWSAEQRLQFREGQKQYGLGREAMRAKKLDEAKAAFAASLKLADPLGDLWGIAQAEQSLGDVAAGAAAGAADAAAKKTLLDEAIAHHKRGAQVFGELRHPGVLRSLRALGNLHEQAGDLKAARFALERMMDVAAEAQRLDNTGPVKKDLARLCRALGDEDAAKKWDA